MVIKRCRGAEMWARGICFLVVLLLAGCAGATPAAPTTQPTPAVTPPRLRLVNQGQVDITRLVVLMPDQRIEFGSVPAGTTTDYQVVSKGVYRYAAYEAEIDGRVYEQPVIDWVGETPMDGQDFTYRLRVDPTKWETQGWVIQLEQVDRDR